MDANDTRTGTGGHPWLDLEDCFQTIWNLLRQGIGSRSPEFREAEKAIRKRLEATARRILGGPRPRGIDEDAEDALQTWIAEKVPVLLERYEPGREFFPFGYRCFVRFCYSLSKRAKYRKTKCLGFDLIGRMPNPADFAEKKEAHQHLLMAMELLTQEERDALRDKYWHGRRSKYSAELRNTTHRAIDTIRFHAIKKLRKLLALPMSILLSMLNAKKKLAG